MGVFLFSLNFVSAIPTYKQGDTIQLTTVCDNCTQVNLTSVTYPNGTFALLGEFPMTKNGTNYNFSFSDTNTLGTYRYVTCGDLDGVLTCEDTVDREFIITRTGESSNSSQAIITMGIIGVMFLFFGLARSFRKEKWKLKLAFDILALLMAVVAINSFRIIVSESSNLGTLSMGALVAVITILFLMISYFLVLITIEIINYFKNKESLRWKVDGSAY